VSDVEKLAAAHGLELLDRLHETLSRFQKEEADLLRRFRDRRHASRRTHAERVEAAERLHADQTREIEAAHDAEKQRIERIHDRRRARIQSLATTGIRTAPKHGQEERERWLGELQMRHFLTTRRLQGEREAVDAKFQIGLGEIAKHRVRLRTLERRARDYFLGYPRFLWLAKAKSVPPVADADAASLERRLDAAEERLAQFRQVLLPKVFSFAPLWAALPVIAVIVFLVLRHPGEWLVPAILFGAITVALIALHAIGGGQSHKLAEAVAVALAEARGLLAAAEAAETAAHQKERERIDADTAQLEAEIEKKWERAEEVKHEAAARQRHRFESRLPRALARNDRLYRAARERLEAGNRAQREETEKRVEALRNAAVSGDAQATASVTEEESAAWNDLEARWKQAIEPLYAEIAAMNAIAAATFPAWSSEFIAAWRPPVEFLPVTKFAHLDVGIPLTAGSRLTLPGAPQLAIPLALAYPEAGSLLFEVNGPGGEAIVSCLNQVILRLLATTPPGKLAFTIFDPVGLGQNFAGLMHLADFEESLITRRIWTQSDQIETRLAELNQHIEKIIQMYLRDEYPTIVEYNAQAGSTAEKFHFLVVADFPNGFSETAIRRLQSIVTSGPRCGVYTLIHWDKRQPLPSGFVPDELRGASICIQGGRSGLYLENGQTAVDARLTLDAAPEPELALEFVQKVGAASTDSNQVQVPFRAIAPAELWRGDTTNELRVAIGRTGATKQQMLAIGKGTRQHALIAGKTGSGKSTLFHVMITNLALTCSPEQVEFYLIDFKKGVEFKCYATKKLPHARVVAIESDREFGLSVLQRVDEELRRRGDLFRKLGAQDIAGYKRAGGTEPMPRSLLIIDEFQEFFVEDDSIAQSASVLLDRIVRQGRAFGIHVLLGSQTLGGAYSLARATLGQMVIRIALQCNEADAYLIMDDNNPAPRLLSRPGEGIYNDAAGAVEGNSPFQVCWLPDDERDTWLDKVRDAAGKQPALDAAPIVFEGNAPADIAENALLAHVLAMRATKAPVSPRAWIGAPNSIKGPTEITFHRQSGNNLLIVGQRDEAALAMLGNILLALGAQYPAGAARFVFLHQLPPGSGDAEHLDNVLAAVPHTVTLASATNAADVIAELSQELKHRMEGEGSGEEIYVFIHGLQRFRKLRQEDEFDFSGGDEPKPGAQFAELIAEGAAHGIHVLAFLDTFNSVGRFLSRKALSEFELRVVFQMSANDSAALIDSPKAGNLGLHRALLYNEHEGTLETFRPYAPPSAGWLERIAGAASNAQDRRP
jgi:ABC-type multidrug transport system fused ATPase/permease subunit